MIRASRAVFDFNPYSGVLEASDGFVFNVRPVLDAYFDSSYKVTCDLSLFTSDDASPHRRTAEDGFYFDIPVLKKNYSFYSWINSCNPHSIGTKFIICDSFYVMCKDDPVVNGVYYFSDPDCVAVMDFKGVSYVA